MPFGALIVLDMHSLDLIPLAFSMQYLNFCALFCGFKGYAMQYFYTLPLNAVSSPAARGRIRRKGEGGATI